MLQAVQYGQAMKHKQVTGIDLPHIFPRPLGKIYLQYIQEPEVHTQYNMPFQKAPQGMPFTAENPGYSGQFG